MFWKPLWEDIQAYERAQETTGEEINQVELYNLARQRYRGMFKGRNDYGLERMFSVYDALFLHKINQFPSYDPTWRFLKPETEDVRKYGDGKFIDEYGVLRQRLRK